MLNRVRPWLRSIALRRRLEREMRDEMAEHLERATGRLMGRGLPAEEARRAAEREFGNVVYLQEQARDARGARWLDALVADVRFALRQFVRAPGTTFTMFVVLVGGISISALLFSYVHSYATLPPPGMDRDGARVRIRGSLSAGVDGRGPRGFAEDEFREYVQLGGQFDAVAGWSDSPVVLGIGSDAAGGGLDARAAFVTEGYFRVMGVRPILGPGLAAGAEGASPVVVIGHAVWDQFFGRDPGVVGRTIEVNGVPVTVAGVAPERFRGVGGFSRFHVWLPLSIRPLLLPEPANAMRAAARLRAGVSGAEATAAVRLVAARAIESNDELRRLEASAEVVPLLAANGDPMFDRDVRLMSFSVGLLALLVLLVACTNVSALVTGLALARRAEIAIRLSLGAGRPRIIRQLLTESALLASTAALAAVGVVTLVLQAVSRYLPALPLELGISWTATMFTFVTALAVGILFGLSPALHATRLAVAGALRGSAANIAAARSRLQRGLVVAQIAFTQPLIVLLAAVLLLVLGQLSPITRTPVADEVINLVVRSAGVAAAASASEGESMQQARASMTRVLEVLRATPGVRGAVIDWRWEDELGTYTVHSDESAGDASRPRVRLSGEMAAADYFEVMGIPLVRGREFTSRDAAHTRGATDVPAIIGADLGRRLWPGEDPIGRRLLAATDTAQGPATLLVVGLIEDPVAERRRQGADYRVYIPPDTARAYQRLVIRTAGSAAELVSTVREAVEETAPGLAVSLQTLADYEAQNAYRFRLVTSGITSAGLIALFLSAIGLYAVVSFAVGQRTAEIAVRLAVGAHSRQIVRKFVADGLKLSGLGLLFGLPVSLLGLRTLMSVPDVPTVALPGVTAVVAAGVLLIATAAVWIPARRAAAVDPAVTLRRE